MILKNNICMVVYSYYPKDNRVRREAESLSQYYNIDIISLKNDNEKEFEIVNNINVYRIPMTTNRKGNRIRYIIQYLSFFLLSFFLLSYLFIRKKYKVLHLHSLPDFIVFIGILPKIFNTKIILDLHEAAPEIYLSKMRIDNRKDFFYKLLILIEQYSIKFADIILTVNESIKKIFIQRGADSRKIYVIHNILPMKKVKLKNKNKIKLKILFSGAFNEYNDFHLIIKTIKLLKRDHSLRCLLIGDGIMKQEIIYNIKKNKLQKEIKIKPWVPQTLLINKILPNYDIGILPLKANPITDIALTTKIFDYIYSGLVCIVPKLKALSNFFPNNTVYFYNPESIIDMYNKFIDIIHNQQLAIKKRNNAFNYLIDNNITWKRMETKLSKIYNSII